MKSLNDAIENFHPENWVLVLSIDLDTSAHEWFQKVQAEYAAKTSVGQFFASDIVRELIHRRKLRDAFFPGAVLDTLAVRRSLEGLGTLDPKALDDLSAKSLDEQIARLEEFDARFNYRISYAPDAGADIANATPQGPLHIASVMEGAKRTDIFVRDPEAVRLDPPKVRFSVNRSGIKKLQEFYKTGKVQRLLPGEVTVPSAAFDFARPAGQPTSWQLVLMPSARITGQTLSWRVTASDGAEEVRYDLIKFRIVAAGNEQVELESISPLPFVLELTLRTKDKPGGNLAFNERFRNERLSAVAKALRFKHLLAKGAGVELYSLDADLPVGVFSKGENPASDISAPDRVHLDMAEVASVFGWDVTFPEKIDEEDLHQLAFLVLLVRDLPLPVEVISGAMQKTPENLRMVREHESSDFEVIACYDSPFTPMIFCGTEVSTGRFLLRSVDGRILDAAGFGQRLEAANDGELVPVDFKVGVVHGHRAPEWKPGLYVRPIEAGEQTSANPDEEGAVNPE